MNKEFIPYEQALELKQLGFKEDCLGEWQNLKSGKNLVVDEEVDRVFDVPVLGADIRAPLYQQAFRWFREKLADGSVCRHGTADGGYSYRWDIVYEYGVYEERHFKQDYKTYEEAELACLKRLIEIVKNK